MLTYVMHPFRPRLIVGNRAFTHFSGWMLIRNISTGLSDHVVNLLIGRAVIVSALAYFSVARELADMATTESQAPIRRAMFPGFAAVSHDAALLRRSYVGWTAVMVLLTFPIPIGLALIAEDVVRVLLGERWLPVVAFAADSRVRGHFSRVRRRVAADVDRDRPDAIGRSGPSFAPSS